MCWSTKGRPESCHLARSRARSRAPRGPRLLVVYIQYHHSFCLHNFGWGWDWWLCSTFIVFVFVCICICIWFDLQAVGLWLWRGVPGPSCPTFPTFPRFLLAACYLQGLQQDFQILLALRSNCRRIHAAFSFTKFFSSTKPLQLRQNLCSFRACWPAGLSNHAKPQTLEMESFAECTLRLLNSSSPLQKAL